MTDPANIDPSDPHHTPTLLHHQVPPFLSVRNGQLWVQLWVPDHLPHRDVFLRLEPDNEERLVPMSEIAPHGRFRVFEVQLEYDGSRAGRRTAR